MIAATVPPLAAPSLTFGALVVIVPLVATECRPR